MDHPNRRISNRYLRYILQAIEDEMGGHTLRMVLRQAGMDRYVGQLPAPDSKAVAYASELASLQHAIRTYYGRGARGSLNRIGRAVWRRIVAEAPLQKKIRLSLIRLLPLASRPSTTLDGLIAEIREPDGQFALHSMDQNLLFVDHSGDYSLGQTADEPICWITKGMIQEALDWATGQHYDVDETACRATGAKACEFKIYVQ